MMEKDYGKPPERGKSHKPGLVNSRRERMFVQDSQIVSFRRIWKKGFLCELSQVSKHFEVHKHIVYDPAHIYQFAPRDGIECFYSFN